MANVGHTIIAAAGPETTLAAFLAHVRATARDRLAFTLSGLLAPEPVSDAGTRWAAVKQGRRGVKLSAGLAYDCGVLCLAPCLSARFPALRIAGFFSAECDPDAFAALACEAGALLYTAHFDSKLGCLVPMPPGDGGATGACPSTPARPHATAPPPTSSTRRRLHSSPASPPSPDAGARRAGTTPA